MTSPPIQRQVHALMPPGEAGGFIVRTVAETASEEELNADIAYLINGLKEMRPIQNEGSQ